MSVDAVAHQAQRSGICPETPNPRATLSAQADPVSLLRRHFVIPYHRMPSHTPRVPPHGRSAGAFLPRARADVVARCLSAALLVSGATRNDTTLVACMLGGGEPLSLLSCGAHVRGLLPDERTLLGLLHRALPTTRGDDEQQPPTPAHGGSDARFNSLAGSRSCCVGMRVLVGGLARALQEVMLPMTLILVLDVGGEPVASALPRLLSAAPSAVVIVLGDDEGLLKEDMDAVDAAIATGEGAVVATRISLGHLPLLASACITTLHHWLDALVGPSHCDKPRRSHDDDAPPVCERCRPPL